MLETTHLLTHLSYPSTHLTTHPPTYLPTYLSTFLPAHIIQCSNKGATGARVSGHRGRSCGLRYYNHPHPLNAHKQTYAHKHNILSTHTHFYKHIHTNTYTHAQEHTPFQRTLSTHPFNTSVKTLFQLTQSTHHLLS